MHNKWFTLYYAPLRPYVNRFVQKTRRFLWDWLPDFLLIITSVVVFMFIWELCFWK